MKKKPSIWLVILLLIFFIGWWQLPLQYFQQDEWHHFGAEYVWHNKGFLSFFKEDVLSLFGVRFLPLASILNYVQFSLFGISSIGYAIVSLLFHLLNTILVYLLVLKLTKNRTTSFLTSSLFCTSISSYQATSWLIQHTTTLPALTFSILSLYFLIRFTESFLKKDILLSLFFIFIAVSFKETALFLFPFSFIFVLFYARLKKEKRLYKISPISILLGLIYVFLLMFFSLKQPVEQTNYFIPNGGFFSLFLQRMFIIPVKTISQSFIPAKLWIYFVEGINKIIVLQDFGLTEDGTAATKFLIEILMYFFSIAIFLISLLTLKKVNKKNHFVANSIFFGFSLIICSSIPLMLIPGDSISYLDSRYLYIPVLGSSLILATIINSFLLSNENPNRRKLGYFISVILILVNILGLNKVLANEIETGNIRRGILEKIKQLNPKLPEKTIFFTESDSSFYGLSPEERILPFQSGFGQTLFVSYQGNEHFPIDFFQDRFLWEIESQGYKEVKERGFGYFRDFDLMVEKMEEEDIPEDSIIAFRYDSESKLLQETTEEIQGRVRGFRSVKKLLNFSDFTFKTSENSSEAYLAVDGNRKTKWDSNLQYIYPQFVTINLKSSKNISQIRIDSFNNKDQNAVGYRVLLSNDGEEWKQVFYAKQYIPNNEGLVDLYFEPQPALFIKIEQIGKHRFASWVIHEIYLYETVK